MSEKQKILCCGDVEGKFNSLFSRVQKINQKSGPFDMLLCVGNFFGINNTQFTPYKLGDKKVPIPTYVLGPNKEEHISLYPEDDSELCENVSYLGKRGIFTTSKGVKIAYVSGVDSTAKQPFNFNQEDVKDVYSMSVRSNPAFRGVDILLTSQWPAGIIHEPSAAKINSSSNLLSWLIMKTKPRYVFSGLEGLYYERPPFRCNNLGDLDATFETVTRFIGLARVDNAEKSKWIYALSVTPLDKMKVSELMQKTIDETECPFNFDELEHKIFNKCKPGSAKQYFYDTNSPEDGPKKKKQRKERPVFDQSKCWFCLASPSVEKHLIISVGNTVYLALAKGGMVEEHFLICPIEHYQSTLELPAEVLQEINIFKDALCKFYARKNEIPIFFERNYKTSHMQLQVVPIPKGADKELKEIFIEEAEGHGFHLDEIESHSRLDQLVQKGVPYFTAELPSCSLYTKIQGNSNFPLNFGREVLATGPILNLKDRIEWKDCILSKSDEELLIQRLRNDFEPFDVIA